MQKTNSYRKSANEIDLQYISIDLSLDKFGQIYSLHITSLTCRMDLSLSAWCYLDLLQGLTFSLKIKVIVQLAD